MPIALWGFAFGAFPAPAGASVVATKDVERGKP